MSSSTLPRVAILGLGLMGGSLFQLLRHRGHPVSGYDVDPQTRQLVHEQTAGGVHDSVAQTLAGADLTVIAVPMWSVGQVVNEIARSGYTGLITDVVSVKSAVSQAVQQHLPGGRWIGGHPMVGSEKSGFTASSVTLLENCPWVLCLDRADQLPDWLWLAEWITSLGSRVVPTTLSEHDSVVARVSHLPHVLAAALTNVVAAGQMGDLALSVAAGSFRDATRVAASSPEATAAWCRANSQALSVELDAIAAQLDMFREAFKAATQSNSAVGPGSDVMTAWLRGAHQLRKAWPMPAGASRRVERSLAAISAIGRSGGWIASVNEKWITAVAPGVTPTNSSADKKV